MAIFTNLGESRAVALPAFGQVERSRAIDDEFDVSRIRNSESSIDD